MQPASSSDQQNEILRLRRLEREARREAQQWRASCREWEQAAKTLKARLDVANAEIERLRGSYTDTTAEELPPPKELNP